MEGYILVASGKPKYFTMAAACARSIRFFDPTRQICLACDNPQTIAEEDKHLFDHTVLLQNLDTLRGTEHHLYLNTLSPFERTIYIDADTLVANKRIHDMWTLLKDYRVTFPGRKLTEGFWRVDITELRERFGLDYIVQLNGGVFYFDRSPESDNFFKTAQGLFETQAKAITTKHNTGGGLANEPIWGITMAMTGMDIFPLTEHMNVSTLRTERWEITSEPTLTLFKDDREWHPVICHFLGLGGPKCPNDLYRAFSNLVSVPPPAAEPAPAETVAAPAEAAPAAETPSVPESSAPAAEAVAPAADTAIVAETPEVAVAPAAEAQPAELPVSPESH